MGAAGPVSYTHLDVYKRQVLINNAAAQYNLPFPSYDEQHLRRLLYTNVGGYLLMAQAVLPYMRARCV